MSSEYAPFLNTRHPQQMTSVQLFKHTMEFVKSAICHFPYRSYPALSHCSAQATNNVDDMSRTIRCDLNIQRFLIICMKFIHHRAMRACNMSPAAIRKSDRRLIPTHPCAPQKPSRSMSSNMSLQSYNEEIVEQVATPFIHIAQLPLLAPVPQFPPTRSDLTLFFSCLAHSRT